MNKNVIIGFLPWVVFSVLTNRGGVGAVGTAALLALLVAVGLIARDLVRGRRPGLIEVAGLIVFLTLGTWSTMTPAADQFIAGYGRAIAALTLSLVIFLTLPSHPFTERYARESVPRQEWNTAAFRSINRRISALWGVVLLAMAAGHALGTLLGAGPGEASGGGLLQRPVDLVFNWVIPAVLVLGAVKATQSIATATRPAESTALTRTVDC